MNALLSILLTLTPSQWSNSILNPSNQEFIIEVAFNLHKGDVSKVTQTEFDNRYLINNQN